LAAYVPDEADLPDAIAFCGQIKEEAKLKRQRIKGGAEQGQPPFNRA